MTKVNIRTDAMQMTVGDMFPALLIEQITDMFDCVAISMNIHPDVLTVKLFFIDKDEYLESKIENWRGHQTRHAARLAAFDIMDGYCKIALKGK